MFFYRSFLLIIILFLSISSVFAEEKLQSFKCNSLASAKACDNSCENIGQIDFDVEIGEQSSIINVVQFRDKHTSSSSLEGCIVENKMSWQCVSEDSFSKTEHYMVNGGYWWSLRYKMLDGNDDVTQGCAK